MIKDYDQLIKLILIGSSGVGKSSILMQFAENKFSENYLTTIGVDFRFKTVKDSDKTIKFQIWDTAGQERFRTITSAYYKGADGIIVVYDVTEPSSLDDVEQFWIPEAYNYCDKGINVLMLGNKSDCDKKINSSKVNQIVETHGFRHAEVSAKTSDRIQESIKNFGLMVAAKKAERNSTSFQQQNTPGGGQSSNSGSRAQSVGKESSTVNIGDRKSSENLTYKKKCC